MARKMHIAGSGAKAGQWVTCGARKNCRVGGTHTTADSLQGAKLWAGKKRITDLTPDDYIGYLEDKLNIYGNEPVSQDELLSSVEYEVLADKAKIDWEEHDEALNKVIAQQDASFEEVRVFTLSTIGDDENKSFVFTDNEGHSSTFSESEVHDISGALNQASMEYSNAVERDFNVAIKDDYAYGTQEEANYRALTHIEPLGKKITFEEVDRLYAEISDIKSGPESAFSLLETLKRTQANASISFDRLMENLK